MLNNDMFERWLDEKSTEIANKIGTSKPISSEEMIVLVLKFQSNHFEHLDEDLRNEMKCLRSDVAKDMKHLRQDMDKRFEQTFSLMKWQMGLFFTAFLGIYVKLFFG